LHPFEDDSGHDDIVAAAGRARAVAHSRSSPGHAAAIRTEWKDRSTEHSSRPPTTAERAAGLAACETAVQPHYRLQLKHRRDRLAGAYGAWTGPHSQSSRSEGDRSATAWRPGIAGRSTHHKNPSYLRSHSGRRRSEHWREARRV